MSSALPKHADLRSKLIALTDKRSALSTVWVGGYRALMLQIEQSCGDAAIAGQAKRCRNLAADFVSVPGPSARANLFLQMKHVEALLADALEVQARAS